MSKSIEKIPFLFAFFALLFLYNFCSVLCFVVEDYFGEFIRPAFLFESDYWSSVASMLCSGIMASIFQRSVPQSTAGKIATQILFECLLIVVITHISQIVSDYFSADATLSDLWVFFINVMAVLLFMLFGHLIGKAIDTGSNKYHFIISGIFSACFITAVCCSAYYMPREVIKTLKQDAKTVKTIKNIVNLSSGDHLPELPKEIDVKDTDGKRTITWYFVTDFEKLESSGKFTARLKKKFEIVSSIYKKGTHVCDINLKKGKQELILNLPGKKKS